MMFSRFYTSSPPDTEPNNSLDSLDSLSGSEDELRDREVANIEAVPSVYNATLFQVHYLGMIADVNLGARASRDPDVQLIDKLEEGQLEGKISMVPKDDDLVSLTVSKHGLKVTDISNTEVLQRHPLHTVAQVVFYTDSFYKSNVAFKIGQVGRTVFDCYVFHCSSEMQAQNICEEVKKVFEVITGR